MPSRVHVLGVCGSGMSGIAMWYRMQGCEVSGCDRSPHSPEALEAAGIEVLEGHGPGHAADADLMVHSAAVPRSHPELVEAAGRGVRVLRRSEALEELCAGRRVVAVAGAHGKTTTTSMTGWVLQEAGADPTVLAGGTVPPWGGGFRRGGDLTVVEADEYDRAFLRIPHRIAAVTSFDAEHLECYGSVELLRHSFQVFLELTGPGGGVVVPVEHEDLAFWAERIGRTVLLAGPGGHWECIGTGAAGWGERYVARGLEGYLPLPGLQNLRNASTCLALAELCGIPAPVAMRALESYPGVARRLERLGVWKGRLLVSDYAHHPREMEASINALRRASTGTLCVVFEPHLFSRTARLADEMGAALAMADRSLVLPVYAAREDPVEGVDSRMVAEAAGMAGGSCAAVEPSDLGRVLEDVRADTIVFMGAGDSDTLARRLLGSVR